tara:strand:- start:34044 stop:34241 length:198 start_codon:yes stop_codon:yes gene_type:complete
MSKKNPWEEKSGDAKTADKRIKYCPGCKKCWESIYYGSKQNIYHYLDFPTYGKAREICKVCVEKN